MLYIYIDQVTENSVVYQAAWKNDNGTQQNVYGNFKITIKRSQGGIVVHKRLSNADRAVTDVYQLDAVFDVLNASGEKVGSISTDPKTGEGLIDDLPSRKLYAERSQSPEICHHIDCFLEL